MNLKSKEAVNMYKLQETIRNNTTDIHSTVGDLINWSSEQNAKEKKGKPTTTTATKAVPLPPIRNKIDIS
jgi:hypothetical protein